MKHFSIGLTCLCFGIYDYLHEKLSQKDPQAYWNPGKPKNKSDRKEYGYIEKNSLRVATVHWKEVFWAVAFSLVALREGQQVKKLAQVDWLSQKINND